MDNNSQPVQQPVQQPVYQQPQVQPMPQYQPQGIPAEVPSTKAGKVFGILSVILGAISIIGTIFTAPFGIIFGALAISRGDKTMGAIGLSLSIFMMILGLVFVYFYMDKNPEPAAMMPIGVLLNL